MNLNINISFKSFAIYALITGGVASLFLGGTYIFITRMGVNALTYTIPAYIGFGLLKLILLAIFWRRIR